MQLRSVLCVCVISSHKGFYFIHIINVIAIYHLCDCVVAGLGQHPNVTLSAEHQYVYACICVCMHTRVCVVVNTIMSLLVVCS